MGVLIETRHDHKFFQSVPDLCPAIENFTAKKGKDLVANLGKVFVKHEVYKLYGLIVAHRHFDLKDNEILVETFNSDSTISAAIPWNVKESKATPTDDPIWKSLELNENKFVVPQTWCFDLLGQLKAFEYCSTNEALRNPSAEFVAELFMELKKLGLDSIVGLRRITSGKASWESTPEGVRASITTFGLKPEDADEMEMIAVGWQFNEKGEIPGRGSHFCTNCRNCTTCTTNNCKSHQKK